MGDDRPARRAAARQSRPHDRAGELRGALSGLGIQRSEEERAPEPFVERAPAIHDGVDAPVLARRKKREHGEIVERPRAGDAAMRRKNPPGKRPGVWPHAPAFLCGEVDEGEIGLARLRQRAKAADDAQEIQRVGIARQQQMIAVVDHHAKRRIEIGAAASASLPRRSCSSRR